MSFGRECSENIAKAERLFHGGQVDEARTLMSWVRGCVELYREQPDMMEGWEPSEVADMHQAWEDLCAAWARIKPVWDQRPAQWQ